MTAFFTLSLLAALAFTSVLALTLGWFGFVVDPLTTTQVVSVAMASVGFTYRYLGRSKHPFYSGLSVLYGTSLLLVGGAVFLGTFMRESGIAFSLLAIGVPIVGGVSLVPRLRATYPLEAPLQETGNVAFMLTFCLMAFTLLLWWVPDGDLRMCMANGVLFFLFAGCFAWISTRIKDPEALERERKRNWRAF